MFHGCVCKTWVLEDFSTKISKGANTYKNDLSCTTLAKRDSLFPRLNRGFTSISFRRTIFWTLWALPKPWPLCIGPVNHGHFVQLFILKSEVGYCPWHCWICGIFFFLNQSLMLTFTMTKYLRLYQTHEQILLEYSPPPPKKLLWWTCHEQCQNSSRLC